eukprot:14196401-Alexandrium_andersonii.AAC.1
MFPPDMLGSRIVMLSKNQGEAPLAQRPIGILGRVYRVWAAARSVEAAQWEVQLGDGWSWGCGEGRSASDAVWDTVCHGEVASAAR